MPIILKFPPRRPNPELSLDNLLKTRHVEKFGQFGMWFAKVTLGNQSSWLPDVIHAKIDTGATISLFPEFLAEILGLTNGIRYEFYGVVRTKECKIPVTLYQINIRITDNENQNLTLNNIWAAFTPLERSPALLGYKDVLERLIIGQIPSLGILTLQMDE